MALYCLLGVCPVFVTGTGRKMSSPYRDELTFYNTSRIRRPRPYCASITSGSVPFRSAFYSFPTIYTIIVLFLFKTLLTLVNSTKFATCYVCCQLGYCTCSLSTLTLSLLSPLCTCNTTTLICGGFVCYIVSHSL